MTTVLDSSAVLASLLNEPGGSRTEAVLRTSVLSAVNWAEIVEKLAARGIGKAGIQEIADVMGTALIPADRDVALEAGLMRSKTEFAGLSLGDRFCLALAKSLGAPVLTADRNWVRVAEEIGVEIELIR